MWWKKYAERAVKELEEIRNRFPAAQLVKAPLKHKYCPACRTANQNDAPHLSVLVRMRTPTGGEFPMVMVYPCNFPNRIPVVYLLITLDPKPPRHQFSDGRLCLTGNEHNPRIGGAVVLDWAHDWVLCYEVWKLTGSFPSSNNGRHRV